MIITSKDIKWGKYRGRVSDLTDDYEGPFFPGIYPYVLPSQPSFLDKVLAVISATEGNVDALNMYDRCILSSGLIQFCEAAQFSVSALLGKCAETDQFMFEHNLRSFPITVEFKKNTAGLWRFFFKGGQEVKTLEQQRQLFLGSSTTGKQGSWTPETIAHAKSVAAWFVNFWQLPLFRTVQAEYIKNKLPKFVMKEAHQILFATMRTDQQFSWDGALRAAYYSFAANLPSIASKSIQVAVARPDWESADSADKFRIGLQALTFAPNIEIYAARYEAIAPVLAKIFGVDIPKHAQELKNWKDAPPVVPVQLTEFEKNYAARLIEISNNVMLGHHVGLESLDVLFERGEV